MERSPSPTAAPDRHAMNLHIQMLDPLAGLVADRTIFPERRKELVLPLPIILFNPLDLLRGKPGTRPAHRLSPPAPRNIHSPAPCEYVPPAQR